MRKKCLFLFTLLLSIVTAGNSNAQDAPAIEWQKSFGGSGNDIMQDICPTRDGNYILLGLTSADDGDVDCVTKGKHDTWVIKMDPAGNIIWQHCYGGTLEEGNPNSKIIQTSDGGYLFQTETWSNDIDVVGHHDLSDAWTVKLDSLGNIQWSRSYGGYNWDVPRNILELPHHKYLCLSRSTSSDGDVPPNIDTVGFDAWVFIVDSVGNILVNKIYGGTGNDDLYKAIPDRKGNYILFGLTSSTDGDLTGIGVDSTDGWILTIDTLGNILSNRIYGSGHTQSFLDAIASDDGGYLATGESDNPLPVNNGSYHGEADFWAVKFDSDFNIQWQGLYGGSSNETFRRVSKADGTNGYFLAGTTVSVDGDVTKSKQRGRDYWIIQISADGKLNWSLALGGSGADYCYSMVPSGIAVGGTYSDDGDVIGLDGDADGWVFQLSYPTQTVAVSQNNSVKIYPNPSSSIINIQMTENGNTVEVRNVLGQLLYATQSNDNHLQIHVNNWIPGIYYVVVSDPKKGTARYVEHFEVAK